RLLEYALLMALTVLRTTYLQRTSGELFYVIFDFSNLLLELSLSSYLQGKHLEPVGIKINRYIVDFNPFDKFIQPLSRRQLERFTVEFLAQLRQRQSKLEACSDSATSINLAIESPLCCSRV
ncbi:hypothetical protein NC995_25665, partial [Leptolyngbya sp. FACHB-1515]